MIPESATYRKSTAREYFESICVAVILALFVRTFVVQAFKIPTGSMENNLLIGVAILESKFIGARQETLQLKFLHVSRDSRKQGLGRSLFNTAVEKAKTLGAQKLYISATPSENTINYYLRLGCVPATETDPELFALEPEDIHLEYVISYINK